MKRRLGCFILLAFATSAFAEVQVSVQGSNGLAWVRYQCTAGELVRGFALDVSVDQGQIIGVSHFLRGPGTATSPGYGIFPAAFRDHITVGSGTNINWAVPGYTPLAAKDDYPADTLAGLNSSGVTLEFGGLWDRNAPAATPPAAGVLCALRLSVGATVSVKTNLRRGGVMAAESGQTLTLAFTGGFVQPPEILSQSLTNGALVLTFAGGELESAFAIGGPWIGTGDSDGHYSEPVANSTRRFFRVRNP